MSHQYLGEARYAPKPLSSVELSWELYQLELELGVCSCCRVGSLTTPALRQQHVQSDAHLRSYVNCAFLPVMRDSSWCLLCCVRVPFGFRRHTGGRRHQQLQRSVLAETDIAQAEQLRVEGWLMAHRLDAKPPLPQADSRWIQNGSCSLCHTRCSDFNTVHMHLNGRRHAMNWKQHFDSSFSPPSRLLPPAAAVSYAPLPPPSQPSHQRPLPLPPRARPAPPPRESSLPVIEGNLCRLCQVRISNFREASQGDIAVHVRGCQHRTRLSLQAASWKGEQSMAELQQQAEAVGLSLDVELDGDAVTATELLLEADRRHEIVLCIQNERQTGVRSVFLTPDPHIPGLDWRYVKHAVLQAGDGAELDAAFTPALQHVGTHRCLLAVLFTRATIVRALDLTIVPPGGRADRELLKPSSEYRPRPRVAASSLLSDAGVQVTEGVRPPAAVRAQDVYVRRLDSCRIPQSLLATLANPLSSRLLVSTLQSAVSPVSYVSRFHTLLWLEETQMQIDIQGYDALRSLERRAASTHWLSLQVPGLAESRPSVLYGDRVLVSETPFTDSGSRHAWSGFVHRAELDCVHLRFDPAFVLRAWLPGKLFHVRFTFNRIPLDRCHQAVTKTDANIAKRFFPSLSSPSVIFQPKAQTAAVGVYPFLARWSIDVLTEPERCNQWLLQHVVEPQVMAVGLDTEFVPNGILHPQSVLLLQLATSTACLCFWLQDKTALPQRLQALLQDRTVAKYVVGPDDDWQLFASFATHVEAQCDVQDKVVQSLRLQQLPGLQRLVNAFLPSIPYVKDKAMQRTLFTWPLTDSMAQYAASDAVLALLLGQRLQDAALTLPAMQRAWAEMEARQVEGVTYEAVEAKAEDSTERKSAQTAAPAFAPVALNFINRNLNQEQRDAVTAVCSGNHHPFPYIIFGPPGTGKSTVMLECIEQLLRQGRQAAGRQQQQPEQPSSQRSIRILACAPSNSAADLLCQKLRLSLDTTQMHRMNAVSRQPSTIPAELLPYCALTADGEAGSIRPRVELLRYELLVCTCITAATLWSLGCECGDFSHIFIDEAGQATEPEVMAAMTGLVDAASTRVVLAGDPQQLGPIVRSKTAAEHGLATSLLERLLRDHKHSPQSPYHRQALLPFPTQFITKLLHNYRSHPSILCEPDAMFYESELIASADKLMRESLLRWPHWPAAGFPLLFHHVLGKEEREGDSPSWWNATEVQLVVDYVTRLMAHKSSAMQPADIGIITPYNKQKAKLRSLLRSRLSSTLSPQQLEQLKVGSVEEFQGQERRVVIISTVRSQLLSYLTFDTRFNLGFVGNPKRLNVALTRAKSGIIIVGNANLLNTDPNWRRYIQYIARHGAVIGNYTPPEDEQKAAAAAAGGEADEAGEKLAELFAHLSATRDVEEGKVSGAVDGDVMQDQDEDDAVPVVNEEPAWRVENGI